MPKLFTLDEADRLLPWLRERLTKLLEAQRQLEPVMTELRQFMEKARHNGGGHKGWELAGREGELRKLSTAYEGLVQEISNRGVLIKDPSIGLVDFPTRRDGREVYLCWRLGEDRVAYWHEVDAGVAGRQPL